MDVGKDYGGFATMHARTYTMQEHASAHERVNQSSAAAVREPVERYRRNDIGGTWCVSAHKAEDTV